jgi:hypothetical protein
MNLKHLKFLALIAILIIQNGCAERSLTKPHYDAASDAASDAAIDKEQYHEALKDAAIVEDSDVTDKLLAITRGNPDLVWNEDKSRLLVVTWKSKSDYEKYYEKRTQVSNDLNHPLWITSAPQVKTFCHNYLRENPKATDDQLNLRLKQYLGLPPDSDQKNYLFVELWVNPKDIFRPCVDPEINDSKCDLKIPLCFPAVANIPDYGAFYQNLYFKSFRESSRFPWTGLGYTYDWGNHESKVGASEFILTPNTPYQIKQAVTTGEYCK